MADNPEQNYDPAGSTQMFRAFVDEGVPAGPQAPAPAPAGGGSKTGLIVGVVIAVVVIAAVAYFAMA